MFRLLGTYNFDINLNFGFKNLILAPNFKLMYQRKIMCTLRPIKGYRIEKFGAGYKLEK
jgi:hypothetical protein